uniref:DNA ligase n=1 Tax=Oryzias sinensis TaxID=183150 RepID=A0A8C7ZEV0_9TELE
RVRGGQIAKSPLKVQNGVQEVDSPIKKSGKRCRQIVDSDEDEAPLVKEQAEEQGGRKAPAKTEKVKGMSPLKCLKITPLAFIEGGCFEKRLQTGARTHKHAQTLAPSQPAGIYLLSPHTGNTDEPMEEEAAAVVPGELPENEKTAEGEKAKEKEEEEEVKVEEKSTDEGGEKAEKKEEKEKTADERGPEKVTTEETLEGKGSPKSPIVEKRQKDAKEQKDKEAAKKAPISSFFAPRKAAAKTEKPEKSDGEKKTSAVRKNSEEDRQTEFDPSRPNYHPVDHACWKHSQKLTPLSFCRLRNIETLSNLFRSVLLLSPDDLLCCVYLCLNQLGPAYLGMELGVGETVLMKAVAQATGRQLDKIKAEAQEKGDLGLVAESSRSNQRMMFQPASLTVGSVFKKLKEIASMSGNSAMNKKIDIIKGLFVACRFSEARYIVRSLAGKLRIGLAEQSVLSALSQAVCLTPPGQDFPPAVIDASKGMSAESRRAWIEEKSLILKQTYCEMPNYDIILPVLLKEGIDQLPNHCKLTPGVPLRPMLAHPTKGVGEVMKKFDEAAFTCEYKYDGERAQIHILESGEVRIFSRNQEDNTSKYPDIIARIPKVKKESVVSCVLDSEAVAWDHEKKQIQPFQVLTTRKRKDVDASEIKVQVCVYAFDLLYLNGESLVRQPLCRRRALLRESFMEVEGEFTFARSIDSDSTDAIAEFLEQSVRDSCEGLMVKTLEKDATYEIAKRSHNWLKLKKDYLDGVGDTVDLCVIGAYLGKGKRTGTYGGFLLACYDDENEEFQSVCKIGTGFKDEDLEQHHKFLKEHILPKPRAYYRVDQSAEPDVWLDAVQVWEVKCADLSLSPVYKAAMGLVDPEKGISLRFPRFLRIRDDKKPEDATSGSQIADLYKKQQQIQNQGDKADPEDYY